MMVLLTLWTLWYFVFSDMLFEHWKKQYKNLPSDPNCTAIYDYIEDAQLDDSFPTKEGWYVGDIAFSKEQIDRIRRMVGYD